MRTRLARRASRRDGRVELGVRFESLSFAAQRMLSLFLVDELVARQLTFARFLHAREGLAIEDPVSVARLMKLYTVQRCETLRVYEDDRPWQGRLAVETVGKDGVRALLLGSGGLSLASGASYGFVASGEGSVLAFRATVIEAEAGCVRLALPERVVQSGFRTSTRCPIEPNAPIRAQLVHPAVTQQSRPVDELSACGLSVRLDLTSEPLCPGARLDQLRLQVGRKVVGASGIVRSIDPSANGRIARCGIELTDFDSELERRVWHQASFERLHPKLRAGRRASAHAAWRVLEASNYVSQWSSDAEEQRSRAAYLLSWGPRRGKVGRLLLLEDERRVAATAAGSWLYPRTWMFHHFGVDQQLRQGQRSFLAYSRELYSGALHEYRHMTQLEFFTLYVERGTRWNDLMYQQFANRHRDSSKLRYVPNEVFRCDVASVPPQALDPRVRVADPRDRKRLSQCLARRHDALTLNAMSWHQADFVPGALQGFFTGMRHERGRQVYVYVRGGQPICAAVCESGSEGVNVFGLLNACWLHPLTNDENVCADARRALLRRAVEHYRGLQRRAFVLFEPEGSSCPEALEVGLVHISGGMHWIAHRDVMPAWLTHVRDSLSLTSGRRAQKRVA